MRKFQEGTLMRRCRAMKPYDTKELLTWAEIDLKALSYNYEVCRKLSGNRRVIPVIKADAYGHGAAAVGAHLAAEHGVADFGLARANEGALLRGQGLTKENLIILGGVYNGEIPEIVKYSLEPSVFSLQEAKKLSKEAVKARKKINVHVKINTGMNRLGIRPSDAPSFLKALKRLENLNIRSVYTHFYDADSDNETSVRRQTSLFTVLKEHIGSGVFMHAANSAAIIKYPYAYFNAVRPGIMLYGSSSEEGLVRLSGVKSVMSFKTRVVNIIELKAGDIVSYGATYRARKKERIAIIAAGYGDGFRRDFSNRAEVLLGGERCAVAGRVCMDLTAVKVSKKVRQGDEATIFGEGMPAAALAAIAGTISYEIFTGITNRVVRVYKR